VAIGGIIRDQNFQSFRLVSPAMSKAGEHMGWKANNAALLSHGLTWEDLENQSGETHGRIFVTGGTVYRYQQLSRGSGVGIPLEEWDEELHVKHDEV
jgi:outer membrane protease